MTFCMNVSRFMNLAAIFSLDFESQCTWLTAKGTLGEYYVIPLAYHTIATGGCVPVTGTIFMVLDSQAFKGKCSAVRGVDRWYRP